MPIHASATDIDKYRKRTNTVDATPFPRFLVPFSPPLIGKGEKSAMQPTKFLSPASDQGLMGLVKKDRACELAHTIAWQSLPVTTRRAVMLLQSFLEEEQRQELAG